MEDELQALTECAYSVECTVLTGPDAGLVHRFARFPALLGRGQGVDLRLASAEGDRMLSREHLKISVVGGRVALQDLSTNGTWVGCMQLRPGEPHLLEPDEIVRLSDAITLRLCLAGSSREQPAPLATAPPRAAGAPQPGKQPVLPADPPTSVRRLVFRSLGEQSLFLDGSEVNIWAHRKAAILFACLAELPAGRTVSVERLLELLWSDDLGDPRAALQATVSRTRKAFRKVQPQCADPIELHKGGYRLAAAYPLDCDVASFEACLEAAARARALADEEQALKHLQAAVALYRGPYLDGIAEDWVVTRRQQLQDAYAAAVDEVAEEQRRGGDPAAAARLHEDLLLRDPYREPSLVCVMRCLADMGRRDAVVRRYQEFCRKLQRDLELTPSPETLAIYEALLVHEA